MGVQSEISSMALFALAGVLLIAVSAACGGGGGAGGAQPAASGGKTYSVTATEFKFDPNKFDGNVGQKITFKVTNKGTIEHNFVILNADGSQELAKTTTQPGKTVTLEFTPSAAGKYMIDCNIAGHKQAGMIAELNVQ